jgi:AraC family transcriptional regulator
MKTTSGHVAALKSAPERTDVTVRRTYFSTPELTLTRQCGTEPQGKAPIIAVPCEDTFSIITQLVDFKSHKVWRGKSAMHSGAHAKTSIAITHLGDEWRCQHLSAFDNLRFHIPRSALDAFTYETGQKRISYFDCVSGQLDPVVFHLAQALLTMLDLPLHGYRLYVDHIVLALYAHVTTQYGLRAQRPIRQPSKLALWQETRAKEYMRSHLAQNLSLEQIAHECGLSRAHFARNFKNSTGVPVFEWLQRTRIEHAQLLLLAQDQTIAEIASSCGFVDQSHFTRIFKNIVGIAPGMWRRMFLRAR